MQHKNSEIEKPTFDLKKSIDSTIQEMIKSKEDDPSLFIPTSFLENYNSKEMNNFVKTAYDYCIALFVVEQHHENKEIKNYLSSEISTEIEHIRKLASKMAQSYGRLVLTIFYQRKSSKDEQNFFETLIYYIAKVMQPVFERNQLKWLEDELNRLFRRNHIDNERKKRFPSLGHSKKNQEAIINSILLRSSIPRERLKININESIDLKPAYVKLSAYSALNARSPMISMILPSPSDRVRTFEL